MEIDLNLGVSMDNVIAFPKENKRLDVSNTPVSVDEVARAIEKMKLDFYHDVSDNLVEHIIQSIGSLNIDGEDEIRLREIDIILIREVLASLMCRLGGIPHPLNGLADAVVKDLAISDGAIDYRVSIPGVDPNIKTDPQT